MTGLEKQHHMADIFFRIPLLDAAEDRMRNVQPDFLLDLPDHRPYKGFPMLYVPAGEGNAGPFRIPAVVHQNIATVVIDHAHIG